MYKFKSKYALIYCVENISSLLQFNKKNRQTRDKFYLYEDDKTDKFRYVADK